MVPGGLCSGASVNFRRGTCPVRCTRTGRYKTGLLRELCACSVLNLCCSVIRSQADKWTFPSRRPLRLCGAPAFLGVLCACSVFSALSR